GRRRPLQAERPGNPGRLAAVRRPLLQAVRPRPGRQGAGAPERVRRHAGEPGSQTGTDRRPPQAGAASV
nr:hypothetical protein [Tanacetum cinerariifolium]